MSLKDRVYRTEAIVLRRRDLGEADRILSVFSPDRGKLRVIAKGVRRPGSRKAGHLEPFTRVLLLLARGRDLDLITQAEAIEPYRELRPDLIRLGHAAYAVELLDRFTVEEGGHRILYTLLQQTLERLAAGSDPALVMRFYELHLLEATGFRPELNVCVHGKEEIQAQDQFFSPEAGGVLCPRCGPTQPDTRPISMSALRVTRHLQRSAFAEIENLAVRPAVQAEVERIMELTLTYLLERRLNAPDFLRQVRSLLQGAAGEWAPAAGTRAGAPSAEPAGA
ncbi:MAG: DNA repair protein RecO [Anaerolineales bacterium]